MKTILVIIDGGADLPCKALHGKTPLEAASKPNLDFFASQGKLGLVHTVGKDIAPESDVAVAALLGYDPSLFTGRGPLEAYGAGVKLGKHFLALRANFATVEGSKIVERRAGRTLTTKEARDLARTINQKVKLKCKFLFKSTTEHRGVLVLFGKFSEHISNVDPAYKKEGSFGVAQQVENPEIEECRALQKGAEETAAIVNDFVGQALTILKEHLVNKARIKNGLLPANAVLVRDAGTALPKFEPKKKWAAVAGMPLEIGIAELAGMKVLPFKYPVMKTRNIYGHLYESLRTTIRYAKHYLKKHWKSFDHFYIHFKEADIPGHDNKPEEKMKMIELMDKEFFLFLRKMKDFQLIVTCDHATPCEKKGHSADPVPVLLYGQGSDNSTTFNEREAEKGSLGIRMGKDVLKLL